MSEELQKRRSILLIDDDTSLLVTLKDFLSFEGYEITTADSGEQGLKCLTRMTPDLIILDMSMPGMGGMGFLKAISDPDGKPQHPVLVLTARANLAEFFSNIAVDGFISKPCDPDDLLMEVGRIVFLRSGDKMERAGGPASRRTVLLGECDEQVQQVLTDAFLGAGLAVTRLARGPEVLERAILDRPDVVVMSVALPGMNGDAVARMLREMPNTVNIPVVLYAGAGVSIPELSSDIGKAGRSLVRSNNSVHILSAVTDVLQKMELKA